MNDVVVMPLTVAARRLERSLARLGALSESGDDAAFDAGLAQWFADLQALLSQLQRATGLTGAELAERLVR